MIFYSFFFIQPSKPTITLNAKHPLPTNCLAARAPTTNNQVPTSNIQVPSSRVRWLRFDLVTHSRHSLSTTRWPRSLVCVLESVYSVFWDLGSGSAIWGSIWLACRAEQPRLAIFFVGQLSDHRKLVKGRC